MFALEAASMAEFNRGKQVSCYHCGYAEAGLLTRAITTRLWAEVWAAQHRPDFAADIITL